MLELKEAISEAKPCAPDIQFHPINLAPGVDLLYEIQF